MDLGDKYVKLVEYIKSLEKIVVAFSGGVDSTFLLKAAKDALGDGLIALTIHAPFHPQREIEEAKALARALDVNHIILEQEEISPDIQHNPGDRCYICKKAIFKDIIDFAKNNNYPYITDGSNYDDTKDYRPGMKALRELDILSPLLKFAFTKTEIRDLSKKLGLPTWDKPPYPCLLTRIQYGQEITKEDLLKIEEAEGILFSLGFPMARVRLHNQLVRLEVAPDRLMDFLQEDIITRVVKDFKNIGFQYITVDLEGYRMGSQNEVL